ncbi:MAG: hypothetical protein O7D27_11535 [Alphaproteobacteria bacterium]|nr:hypothetical protein [Alphaproteobacteria bacterium]
MGMTTVLPQQRLLLELLVMSGDIAVNHDDRDSILWRTLKECEDYGWTKLSTVSQEFRSVTITEAGRKAIATALGAQGDC